MLEGDPQNAWDLADRFEAADPRYGPVPIWWWSGARLNRTRLRWQMEQMMGQGITQAVIMCLAPRGPLYGSLADDPAFLSEEWWDIFLAACADADELGFHFWLYDQFGFSGANFQGQLVTGQPDWSGQELRRLERQVPGGPVSVSFPAGSAPVGAYAVPEGSGPGDLPVPLAITGGSVTWNGGPARICLCHAVSQGFDYFNVDACQALLDTVLGAFQRRTGKWFGQVIVGVFQDELPNMPTWGSVFLSSFRAAYGYDLADRVACLWEGDSDAARQVRRDYHAHRAALAREAFFAPYASWAGSAGLMAGFDQQSPAREGDPAGGVRLYGDYTGTHRLFTAPGSDHWGDPKLHSSLAHAGGQPRTWLEAFHSSGWGGTLEETYDWLGPFLRRGATLYNPHAVYYATVSGWWEWAPPSTCWRQPYWPDYQLFADSVSRLCALLSAGDLVADTVLLYPTSTVQADLTLAGPLPGVTRASRIYHELNGTTCWFDEHSGLLDAAGLDYEIFDEATLTRGCAEAGHWRVAGGGFRTVILPAVTVLDDELAGQLARFAAGGGAVLAVGGTPALFTGPETGGAAVFLDAVRRGLIQKVAGAGEVPGLVRRGEVAVTADAPVMLRRYGDALVLLVVAHDDRSGTHMVRAGRAGQAGRLAGGEFSWREYWSGLAGAGYEFIPVGDRHAHVTVTGAAGLRAQRWDPRSGARTDVPVTSAGGDLIIDAAFEDGLVSVLVLAPELPAATGPARGELISATDLRGPWQIHARSTLDNRWGDLGDTSVTGTIPIEIWRLEHAAGAGPAAGAPPAGGWSPVTATYGPYLAVTGPAGACSGPLSPGAPGWQRYEFSLSRGIRKDPLHFETLGPKGMVPEEFLLWPSVAAGQWVAFRTTLTLPDGPGHTLVIGADAERRVFVDAAAAGMEGSGYWTTSEFPAGPGEADLQVWLRQLPAPGPAQPGPAREMRASFAVVSDVEAYRRPEWLEPADEPEVSTVVRFSTTFELAGRSAPGIVQIGSEGPCVIFVNGREAGRQGAFAPYADRRKPEVRPYDVSDLLVTGRNELAVEVTDTGRGVAVLVDSVPARDGGLGLVSDDSWACARGGARVVLALRREQWLDPRWACLRARPHPLPRAAWLDPRAASRGVVADLVPRAVPAGPRVEWLRFPAPVGLTRFTVPTEVPFTALAGGRELAGADGVVSLDAALPAGTPVCLRFDALGGHSAGGLLRGPVQVQTAPLHAELAEWGELGLSSLGGCVSYRRSIDAGPVSPGESVLLDLGDVRGTAEVRVNGMLVQTLIWSPYRADLTEQLRSGPAEVEITVRGTLAGYLAEASPTPAVARGQTRHGLVGPVRITRYRRPAG